MKISHLLPLLLSLSFPGFSMTLNSPAFPGHAAIPTLYTCQGADHSPALDWRDPPTDTKSYVIILNDPDAPAGNWIHWLVFNLPATLRQLPEQANLSALAVVGRNSWGSHDYRGPCPPSGTHRYMLTLYALDTVLSLSAETPIQALNQAMASHILDQATLTGHYP